MSDPSGRRDHLRGLALCAIGVVVISPDALIVRSVDADAWTTVAWRGIFTVGRHGRAAALPATG